MATQAVLTVIETLPGGPVLSAILQLVDTKLKDRAKMEEQWKQMEESLPQWSKTLKQIATSNPHAGEQVSDLLGVVTTFKTFIEEQESPPELDILGRRKKKARSKFMENFGKLEYQLKNTLFLMTAETYLSVTKSHEELIENHKVVINVLKNLQDQGEKHQDQGAKHGELLEDALKMMKRGLLGKGVIQIPEEKLRRKMGGYQSASGERKRELEQELLKWVEDGASRQDALKISLALIREGSDEAKQAALSVLADLSADPEVRKKILQTNEILKAVLEVVRDLPSGPLRNDATNCLAILMQDPARFFKQWEQTELAKTDACKSAIAEVGGITALAKIYAEIPEITAGGVKPPAQRRILRVINALVSLSKNADCRAKFAEDHRHIQPLLHFVCNSSDLSTFENWVDWDSDGEGNQFPIATETAATTFGSARIRNKKWLQSESDAREALWELSLDARCKHVLLELGAYIDLSNGTLNTVPGMSDNPYHSILGWLALANQVAKNAEDAKEALGWAVPGTETDVRLLRIAWNFLSDQDTRLTIVEPRYPGSFALIYLFHKAGIWVLTKSINAHLSPPFDSEWMTLDACLKKNATSLLSGRDDTQKDKALGIFWLCAQAKVINYDDLYSSRAVQIHRQDWEHVLSRCEDLTPQGHVMEHYWAACVLLNMLTWESQSSESSRTRIVRLAARSVWVLMNHGYWRTSVPLAKYLLRKSKPSDMDSSCIPFLATRFLRIGEDNDSDSEEEEDSSDDGSDSEEEKDDSSDGDDDDCRKKCLKRLAKLYPDHKEQIASSDRGDLILRAMRKRQLIDDV